MTQLHSTSEDVEGSSFRDKVRFVRRFLSNPGSVGAILPSSRYLAKAMVGELQLERGDLVVEYGPGTGPMTQGVTWYLTSVDQMSAGYEPPAALAVSLSAPK